MKNWLFALIVGFVFTGLALWLMQFWYEKKQRKRAELLSQKEILNTGFDWDSYAGVDWDPEAWNDPDRGTIFFRCTFGTDPRLYSYFPGDEHWIVEPPAMTPEEEARFQQALKAREEARRVRAEQVVNGEERSVLDS